MKQKQIKILYIFLVIGLGFDGQTCLHPQDTQGYALRALALGERRLAETRRPSLMDYGVAWARIQAPGDGYFIMPIAGREQKALPWEGIEANKTRTIAEDRVYGRLQELIFAVLDLKASERALEDGGILQPAR